MPYSLQSGGEEEEFYYQLQDGEADNADSEALEKMLVGAAVYEAVKAYNNHVKQNGEPDSKEKGEELVQGFTGAFIDREIETRGLDRVDGQKVKFEARRQAKKAYVSE